MLLATIYDPLVWVLSAGRTGALRRATLEATGVDGGDAVLDAGCGTRALVVGAREITGPDASFDVVVLSLVLHYLTPDQKTKAISEARRVLREGGRAVLVDFGRSHGALGRLRAHLMLHGGIAATAPALGALLSAGGLAEVTRAPSPFAARRIARGTRRDR